MLVAEVHERRGLLAREDSRGGLRPHGSMGPKEITNLRQEDRYALMLLFVALLWRRN